MSVFETLDRYKSKVKIEVFNRVIEYKPFTPIGKMIKKEIIRRLIKKQ